MVNSSLFCEDHNTQPLIWCSVIFTVVASFASIYSALQPSIISSIHESFLKQTFDYNKTLIKDLKRETTSKIKEAKIINTQRYSINFRDDGRSKIQVSLYFNNRDSNYSLSYSVDGQDFQKVGERYFYIALPKQTFIVELHDENGKVLKRTDHFKALIQKLRKTYSDRLVNYKKRTSDRWFCDISKCNFDVRPRSDIFCSAVVKTVKLGSGSNHLFKDELDLSSCIENIDICKNAQHLSFQVKPGVPVYAQIGLYDGSIEIVEIRVILSSSVDRNKNDMKGWSELFPIEYRDTPLKAPILISSYTPPSAVVGRFEFVFGVDKCEHKSITPHLLVDTDGRGLIDYGRLKNPIISNRNNLILDTKVKEIGLAVEYDNGKRFGPFWYKVDLREIVMLTTEAIEKPEAICDSYRNRGKCMAKNRHRWFDVDRIDFSDVQKEWKKTLIIKYLITHKLPPIVKVWSA